jgi:hypothetical protein
MSMIDPMQSVLLTEMSDEDIEQLKSEFDQLGSFESTFDMDALPEAVTIDEARATYGTFAVPDDLPQGFDAQPEVFVTQAGTGAYTLNVARAHELVEELHLPIYSLPDRDAYPTVTFTMDVPSAVILTYSGADGEMLAVGQMESPSLSIPDSVDMNALREEILRFPGLPPDFVAELRSIDDWEHTLVIPVPENATSRDVTVHGRPGLLIESSEGSVVFWERGGMLYAVGGNITGPQALDVADSMQ